MELLNKKYTLEIDSIELHFGDRTILSSAYLKVETGMVTSLLGRNGCGKSCLMRIICGDLEAQNSSIHINSIWQQSLNHNQVVYSPQYNILPKELTLQTIFDDYEVNYDIFCLHFPEFTKLKKQKVENMSGGQQRIVNIYIVLNSKSQFAMLDEPFSQIMPIHVTKIKELIKEAASTKGILITDHMYRNILDITDSLYVMSNTTIYPAKSKDDLVRYGYLKSVD